MEVENSRQAGISLSKLRTGKLFIQLPELVRHITQMTEAQILQTLFQAEQLADFAFRKYVLYAKESSSGEVCARKDVTTSASLRVASASLATF